MNNFDIKINLLKLRNATLTNIKGKAATKKCIVIPIEDNQGIYVGEKGAYLHMAALELTNPQFEDTHCIKVTLPKEFREGLSQDEEREFAPILGGMHRFGNAGGTVIEDEADGYGLPF